MLPSRTVFMDPHIVRGFARLRFLLTLLVFGVTGCGGECPCSAKHPANLPTAAATVGQPAAAAPAVNVDWDHGAAQIPVGKDDPIWGAVDAPVTIVEFSDLECPFCARAESTLERVKQTYGPEKVRVVFRHNPLPFHAHAYAAAMAAATVRSVAGSDAFFRFVALALQHQKELSDDNFVTWAVASGVDAQSFREALASQKAKQKIEADRALASRVGARGTPGFRINGIDLEGAQPFDRFAEIIDQQLVEAQKLLAAGTAKSDVYVTLTNRNYKEPALERERAQRDRAEDDTTVWKVPVMSDDPILGPIDAPVTIIVFSDFECPFCGRVEATLKQVRDHYGKDVRIVWKDHPLPFHERALPAAVLGRLVLARRGNAAFWTLHDRLFAAHPELSREELEGLAKEYKIPWSDVEANVAKGNVKERIESSEYLAADFNASGTPHFFVNGVRLSGARPFEEFRTLIDAELVKARALVQHGVKPSHLYREVTKDGKGPEAPEHKDVPRPAANRPAIGPVDAPIVIQQWSDFQCPFCSRVQPTLAALRKEFPTQVRVAWRHLPLPFHAHAALAAEAAEEVFAQKGNAAFWAFHDRVFAAQSEEAGLSSANLEKIAVELGVDAKAFRAALDAHKHQSKLDADQDLAKSVDINGTPAFVINGYFLSGAQPLSEFRRLVRRALSESKGARR